MNYCFLNGTFVIYSNWEKCGDGNESGNYNIFEPEYVPVYKWSINELGEISGMLV